MKELVPIIRSDRKPLWEMLPLKQPLRVNIDPCDLCNFKCDFCFQSKSKDFNGSLMTMEIFERVLNQLKDFDDPINVIQLFCLGEPLINKDLPIYISKIREENVAKEVKITSNGSLLTHELIDDLMAARVDEFVISLNGLSDEDFIRITNTKVNYEQLLDNIQYLYQKREKCHVHIKIIGDYFSDEQKEYFIATMGDIADTINIDGATDHWSGLTDMYKGQQYDVGGVYENKTICALCFYELVIHSDGSVSPCVVDWKKDSQNLGNVYETTLKKIWDSDLRKKILISFLRGVENPYLICNECEYPKSGVSVNLEPYREEILQKYV